MSFSDPVFRFSDTPRIRCLVDQFEADPAFKTEIKRYNNGGSSIQDIIRRLGASDATADEKEIVLKKRDRFSTYDYDESDGSDYEEELIRDDCEIFENAKYVRIARVCGSVVGRLAYGLLSLALDCLPPVTFASLAVVCTLAVACAPKMLTDCVIYPFCRLVFGTLYPAYASYKAVRTKNVKEYVKWMMYWIVFALFTCAETVTDVFFSWFPFYYEVKIILVLWLLSPATKGSSILYRKFVHPALCRREQEIDEYISKAKDQGYHTVLNLGTKGVNYATNVIMQTAIKGGGGLVQQLRKSYSLSDLTVADDHTDGRNQLEEDEAGDIVMDPRLLRRTVSTRGRSPRSVGGARVDMFFPEVDTNLSHGGRRDNVNLGHIRSSEDISSAYIPENISSQDPLTRTASVGGTTRTRSKVTRSTFTSIKRPGAAEDGEVIIEEMDDEHIPSFLLQNSSNIPSENDGAVCSPYSKNMFDEYLKFMMRESIQRELGDDNGLDVDYQKYLEFKKMFESTLTKTLPTASEKLEKTVDSKEDKSLECKETNSSNLDQASQILNDSKTESNEFTRTPILKLNSVEFDGEEKSVVVEEEKDILGENKEPPGPFLIKGSSEAINKSPLSSNVSSDSESMNDSNFTTPNSSPLFRSKLNKGGKYNKRHAPPPPPPVGNYTSSSGQSDKNETDDNVPNEINDAVDSTQDRISPINATLILKPGIIKEVDHPSSGIKDVFISHPAAKRRHKPKNRSGRKSNTKQDSAINKLINLPSRFAFWKADDGKSSVSDDNSFSEDDESTGSTSNYEDTSLSNFGSLVDIKVSSENLADNNLTSNTDSGSKLNLNNDVTQKVSEGEEETFQDAKETTVDSKNSSEHEIITKQESGPMDTNAIITKQESSPMDTDSNTINLSPKVSDTRISTEKLVGNSSDYTYIPLRGETLFIHTESRSTDV